MTSRIRHLAQRVTDDPYFLASALQAYARSEHLDDDALAQALECSQETLTLLRLCRMPRHEPASFREDVHRIASRFGVQVDRLAEAVRRANALEALRRAVAKDRGLLMAAPDRQDVAEYPAEEEGEPQ